MIFITYQTSELKQFYNYNKERHIAYKVINQFFDDCNFAISMNIINNSLEDIFDAIIKNKNENQVYYERVEDNFKNDASPISIFLKWQQLFNKLSEHYRKEAMSLDDEKTLPALKYKIIILNNDEKLGPWQSVEILNAISKEAELYWLTVQDFINVIEKTKVDNNNKIQTFESFERRLNKKAKKILANS